MPSKEKNILEELAEYALPSTDEPMETRVQSIPSDKVLKPNISIGMYLQEAFNISTFAQADKNKLTAKGLAHGILEELPKRIDFLRETEAKWYVTRSLCFRT